MTSEFEVSATRMNLRSGKVRKILSRRYFRTLNVSSRLGEVQGSGVETAKGVGCVNELHVVARDLFGGGREVVEMHVW